MSDPRTSSKIPLTVMLVPRYDVSSSRTEVTQKVSSVELPVDVVLLSMVELLVRVELASKGSVLTSQLMNFQLV